MKAHERRRKKSKRKTSSRRTRANGQDVTRRATADRARAPSRAPAEEPIEEFESTRTQPEFPVVGVGGSAGGLEAFTRLLRALPADTGMAFVFVQHLAPEHGSALTSILARATSMPVHEVVDEAVIAPNHVYVIPPGRDMEILRGRLKLFPREAHGRHHPIDQFFRSLAKSHRNLAIGVVLSGTATDGTVGLEEIKADGGINFAQDDTAQHGGMPQSAIASGCVDFVLPPEGIAAEIARIAAHPYVLPRPEDVVESARRAASVGKDLAPILHQLRSVTGADFTQYKSSTLLRRIRRRTVLLKKEGLRDYAQHLRDDPAEVQALYQDILINVTSFFRDPEVFEVLRTKVIAKLLRERSHHDPLRVWTLGCSTGEEVYSLAMVFAEAMDSTGHQVPMQLFATDLNATGIERARAGMYSKDRLHDVSQDRLRRFFVEQDGGFRIAKPIRDMCVFSQHNVLTDPPFSRMDLVSCRNVLIYLEPALQQRIIPLLHYALKPEGFLVLGASETIGPFRDLFGVEDGKHKIFAKKVVAGRLPLLPGSVARREAGLERQPPASWSPSVAARAAADPGGAGLQREIDRAHLAFAPPAVLVDGNLEILEFRGNTAPYLSPAQGKANHSLLKMAADGLLIPLRALLHRAIKKNVRVSEERVRFGSARGAREVNLEVVPVAGNTAQERCFLVLFDAIGGTEDPPGKTAKRKTRSRAGAAQGESDTARLERELAGTREHLQALIEQQDAANEELQSANEEAQSANEELQSINEELQTSKEEIESSNEELTTLNEELRNRNVELGRANSDLTNLIGSVQVAIVIVGRDLRIRRFSPMAEKLMSIRPTDLGRPITDIRMNLDLPRLDALLGESIDTISPRESEVQGRDGRWYSLRIRPYLTLENKIDGAVLLLVDVDAIRRAREYAEGVIASIRDPLVVLDAELRVRNANQAFYETFDVVREETEGRLLYELGNGQWNIPQLRRLLEELLPEVTVVEDYFVEHEFEGIGRKVMRVNARRLATPAGEDEAILLGIEDVTEATQAAQMQLQASEARYRRLFEAARDGVLILDPSTRKIIDANPFMTELVGYTREELLGKELFELGLLGDEAASRAAFQELLEEGVMRHDDLPLETKDGVRREVEMVSNLYEEEGRQVAQANIRDISERKEVERARDALNDHLAEELADAQVLQQISTLLIPEGDAGILYDQILRTAIAVMRSDMAALQRLDQGRDELELLAWRGFDPAFVESFRRVGVETGTTSGAALRTGQRVLVSDIETWEDIAGTPALAALRAAGVRAAQSTPLVSRSGKTLGMITTHWREPHEPAERDLRLLDMLSRQAADFIERVGLEKELRARVEELDTTHRAKNEFIAVLSHELRTPLNAIRGWIQLLQHPGTSDADRKKGLEVIDRNSAAQAKLIEELLDVHRIASGKLRLELSNVSLQLVVDAVLAAVLPAAREKGIHVEREIEPEPAVVSGDASRLGQVLGNLLNNAIKFTPCGGRIQVALRRTGELAELSVSDDGKGIPATALPHIFDRFRQADPLASRNEGGLGLGLSISKQLVELHGGTLSARSPGKGEGATFTVTLPLLATPEAPRPPLAPDASTVGGLSLDGALVLVVDDEPDAREPLRRVLEQAGAEVIAVASTNEALAAIERQRPDLILSDIAMPGRDGYDLIHSVRDLRPERGGRIPAIALTAFASPVDRERVLGAGYQHHLAKPVDRAVLLGAVAALVSRASSDGAAPEDGPWP